MKTVKPTPERKRKEIELSLRSLTNCCLKRLAHSARSSNTNSISLFEISRDCSVVNSALKKSCWGSWAADFSEFSKQLAAIQARFCVLTAALQDVITS